MGYRSSHLYAGKRIEYTQSSSKPHRLLIWQQEKTILKKIVERHCDTSFQHLDFACGTGRILSFIDSFSLSSIGVDVSSEMLSGVPARLRDQVYCCDITEESIFSAQTEFDLITAFRFFPNAEITLRHEAIESLKCILSSNGILVFNNHRNSSSYFCRLWSLLNRRPYRGMSIMECKQMLKHHDLVILETHNLSIFPESLDHSLTGIPLKLACLFERIYFLLLRRVLPMSCDTIFVCKKSVPS